MTRLHGVRTKEKPDPCGSGLSSSARGRPSPSRGEHCQHLDCDLGGWATDRQQQQMEYGPGIMSRTTRRPAWLACDLVPRTRSSQIVTASPIANFGVKGALES